MTLTVRTNYGASLSPDATAFAHIVEDGGYPRAVQRFLRGWRASSSRDVDLPVEGPVTRVIHSADGQWLACEVALDGSGSRRQIWVVTTDPDDRVARRIDHEEAGTAELIAWDGTLVAAILTGEDGVGRSCLIDPADGRQTVLDLRSGGRLVDAWAGASLIRVGPRGYGGLLEVTVTRDGITYFVVAERPDCYLAEFAVSDDLSTVALLWNMQGRSELQILEYTDYTLTEQIALPGPLA